MDLQFSPEELTFRDEVRDFLQQNLPDEIRRASQRAPSYVSKEHMVTWQKILHAKGWMAPAWPEEYGGPGWDLVRRHLYDEEYQAADCPRVSPFGIGLVGPVIYTFGSEAQKQRYLPKILSSEEFWCQGYSEPGAGSDLASLRTHAVRDGEDYVVNGQKIWTSHAHHADMMFCLVKTDLEVKPQLGISFLLIDMTSPGITVQPIVALDGNHYLNQVFLDDVRVPAANRIGEEGKGWTYAKYLLGNERTGIAGVSKSKRKLERLREIAATERGDGGALSDGASFKARLADVETRLRALEITNLRLLARDRAGGAGAEASMLKIRGTEIEQDLNELLIEALGYYAAPYEPRAVRDDWNEPPVGPEYVEGLMNERLLRRAASIYGGSNEIQRNIISKMVLEL
ncbi:MAG: acyl-CoA dehydrogenase family protein [Alphaproteobacteria bacterium]|jgi:alkylation response protein AidB-like acyl-CoA dehydrogenase|nr:acyl-CoA dehydrogenase family protein [Alphaproteobacteria bacterium]